jgi:hypothetical protein
MIGAPLDWALGRGVQLIPAPRGEKAPLCRGWPDIRLSADEARQQLARGGNLVMRLGRASGDLVDCDLDCSEALALADIYLAPTGAEFGRASQPRSHRLYIAPGGVYRSCGDPATGTMLVELRADGRDGGAHATLIPPSLAGEQREWHGEAIEPAAVNAAGLERRMTWLAIGCLTMRYVSEHAACRPGPDLPSLLWEADRALGRAAFGWLGQPAPDAPRRHPQPRRELSQADIDLGELVRAIPNDCDWPAWNRVGMAIYAASGGFEEGFIAFDGFSARSPKYDPYRTEARWHHYRSSPPSRLSAGTLRYLARENGWRPKEGAA